MKTSFIFHFVYNLYYMLTCFFIAPKEPLKLWKIVHTSVKYELEWQRRDTDRDIISNYTLFWCEHQFDRPYQCPVSTINLY